MDLGLSGRAAIVTGASRGIGKAVARALVAEGCRVLLCARDGDALVAAASELDGKATALAVDVTLPSSAEAIVRECQRAFGRIDVLVNNAGSAVPMALGELSDTDWRAAIDVHLLAPACLSMACASVMRGNRWGRLVHVASVSGREPDPLFAPYSAAKAGMLSLLGSLSRAFAADGVLSNCVIPGVTMTELVVANAAATGERTGRSVDEVMRRLLAKQAVPAGRFGTPEEVASAVVFLASEAAAWITGATLEVDGGTLRAT